MSVSEGNVQARIRLAAAKAGCAMLWRNNSGALVDANGRLVRFGLGNDSQAVNAMHKSSDLIGITSVVVTADMVGQRIGVFTAIEVKEPTWRGVAGDERAVAQDRWMQLVRQWGGRAGFARNEDEAAGIWG